MVKYIHGKADCENFYIYLFLLTFPFDSQSIPHLNIVAKAHIVYSL